FALGLFLVVTLAQTTPAALAQGTQTRSDWAALQTLSPGEKIVVKTKDGDRFTGRFESASDILLVFEDDGRKVSLARDSIRRVQLNRGKSRLKGLLFGAAIGGGIGFAVGGALYFPNRGDIVGTTVPGATALGASIGAGIGAGFGKGNKNETIYEAP
ncbi:MAG: hypothetical protein LC802_23245, partial [Acidobacteria bacterium]|nr:hypothetical protein [Acidobacteriota bacterium]